MLSHVGSLREMSLSCSGDCSADSSAAIKRLPEKVAFRDDSGNSSNSSSSEQLHQLQQQPQQPTQSEDKSRDLRQREFVDTRLWQSADVLLDYSVTDDDSNLHVPLHKAVCCALCRKKQERQRKLQQESPEFSMLNATCHHQDKSLTTGDTNNDSNNNIQDISHSDYDLADSQRIMTSSIDENDSIRSRRISAGTTSPNNGSMAVDQSTDTCGNESKAKAAAIQQDTSQRDVIASDPRTQLTGSRSTLLRGRGVDADETRASIRRRQRSTIHGSPSTLATRNVTDPVLVQALQAIPHTKQIGLHLSPQDERQLSVMAARKQQEYQQQMQREALRQQWETDNKRSKKQTVAAQRRSGDFSHSFSLNPKTSKDNRRSEIGLRISGSSSSSAHPQGVNRSVSCFSHSTSCTCGRDHSHEVHADTVAKSKRVSQHEHCKRHENSGECLCQRCAARGSSERKLPDNEHLLQAMERKAQVERCLEEQKTEMEDYIRQLIEKQEEDERRVNSLKQEQKSKIAERAKQKDKHVKMTRELAKQHEKLERADLQTLQETLDESLSAAEMKARKKREEEAANIRAELQRKIDKSKHKQAFMESELRRWQEEIIAYREEQEKHARAVQLANIERRRETAAKEREMKEKQQKDNLLRMQEQEREWKAHVEASIREKEARSRMILQEKEAMKKQAREMAMISRQMRDKLRLNSSLTDFDRFV